MRIFLVGYMGSGKTTIAKKLASKLDFSVVDLDKEIENAAGTSIPEIFKNQGEKAFRNLERKALREWIAKDDFVMATGGGTPCFFESMDEMNGAGETVYLEMTPKALTDRVIASKQERPILKGLTPDKMEEKIRKQIEKRERFYLRAKHRINGLNLDLDTLVGLVSQSK